LLLKYTKIFGQKYWWNWWEINKNIEKWFKILQFNNF